jgi:hypothetical protein
MHRQEIQPDRKDEQRAVAPCGGYDVFEQADLCVLIPQRDR